MRSFAKSVTGVDYKPTENIERTHFSFRRRRSGGLHRRVQERRWFEKRTGGGLLADDDTGGRPVLPQLRERFRSVYRIGDAGLYDGLDAVVASSLDRDAQGLVAIVGRANARMSETTDI